jgi:hypothetical protein
MGAAVQLAQQDGIVADTNHATDGEAHGRERGTQIAVASLTQCHAIPNVAAPSATTTLDLYDSSGTVIELDSSLEMAELGLGWLTEQTYCVLTLNDDTGVHEPARQLTVSREHHQTLRIFVERTDVDPPTLAGSWNG